MTAIKELEKFVIEPGIYSYESKEYFVYARLERGTGKDKGRLFVSYMALYPVPDGGNRFVREVEDFKAKFKFEKSLIQ